MSINNEIKGNFEEDMGVLAGVWHELSEDMKEFLSKAFAGEKYSNDLYITMSMYAEGLHNIESAVEAISDMTEED